MRHEGKLRDRAQRTKVDARRAAAHRRSVRRHAGKVAIGAATRRASRRGSCFLTLKNTYHLGRAGHYGEMAAKAGLVYLSFTRDGGLRNNLFAVLIDPSSLGDATWQQAEAAAFADCVTACPTAPGQGAVLVPGQPEAAAQRDSTESFVMSDAAWALFASCAKASGSTPESALLDA